MSTWTRCAPMAALAMIAAAAWAAPPGAPRWNQKQVLALGEKLARTLTEGQAAAREAPPQATALQQRTRDAALSSFEQVRRATDAYVAKLRAGWDSDMTAAYFRSVRDGLRDARQLAGDAVPTAEVNAKLSEADAIVAELARYYPDL